MIQRLLLMSLLSLSSHLAFAKTQLTLSKTIYDRIEFSTQYSEDGALIMNVPFAPVHDLKQQIEVVFRDELNGQSLEDRGEAHITVVTPPEAQGWNTGGIGINTLISTEEVIQRYKNSLQTKEFDIVCLGRRSSGDNTVFYLVVDSPDLFEVRLDILNELNSRSNFANIPVFLQPLDYWPHITIGYIGGDVHGATKGRETCIENVELVIQ